VTTIDPAENLNMERHIRHFLRTLNRGGDEPIETRTPAGARKILIDAELAVAVDPPDAIARRGRSCKTGWKSVLGERTDSARDHSDG
jgi:hypothetical protein